METGRWVKIDKFDVSNNGKEESMPYFWHDTEGIILLTWLDRVIYLLILYGGHFTKCHWDSDNI